MLTSHIKTIPMTFHFVNIKKSQQKKFQKKKKKKNSILTSETI